MINGQTFARRNLKSSLNHFNFFSLGLQMNGRALARRVRERERKRKNRKQIWQAKDGMSSNGFIKIISELGWGRRKENKCPSIDCHTFFPRPQWETKSVLMMRNGKANDELDVEWAGCSGWSNGWVTFQLHELFVTKHC